VLKIIDNFNVYNIRKIKEGKYMILGKIIFVRVSLKWSGNFCMLFLCLYISVIILFFRRSISVFLPNSLLSSFLHPFILYPISYFLFIVEFDRGEYFFIQMLNGHVLLRIGGGWDTLEHYLLTHLPKAGK
jgi:hypothetical protein